MPLALILCYEQDGIHTILSVTWMSSLFGACKFLDFWSMHEKLSILFGALALSGFPLALPFHKLNPATSSSSYIQIYPVTAYQLCLPGNEGT